MKYNEIVKVKNSLLKLEIRFMELKDIKLKYRER